VRHAPTTRGGVGSSPLDPARAALELELAADLQEIFGVLLRAARSHASYVALLSVHKDELRGRRALALADDRFDIASITELRVARDLVPAFENAITSRFPYVGEVATGDPAVDQVLAALGGVPRAAMVLPVLVGDRAVALVVGHRGDDAPLALDEVSDLFPLLTASSRVLERGLASRAEASAQKPGKRASTAAVDGADDVVAQRRVLEVYRQYESWEELADAIRALIRTGMESGDPDEDEQLELLIELGALEADRLGRPELAVEAWRSAQTIDAGDRRVLDGLERVLAAEERWNDVIALLEQRAALADDVNERIGLLLNVAALSRERLGDEERAVEAYERILGWRPGHDLAARELEVLYRSRGQWQPLATLLVDVASRHDDPTACVAALRSAAEIYEQRIEDPRAAFLVWTAVLRREPEADDAIAALEELAPAAGAWDELLPECEALAGELEADHLAVAARLWRQLGRWQRHHVGAHDAAAVALERALRLEPDDLDTLDELIEARRAAGAWAELAAALARRAERELDPGRKAELYVELADVHETRLAAPAEAVACNQRALAIEPGCRPALVALRRLHREHGAWEPLADVLAQLSGTLAGVAPRADVIGLRVELGEVLAAHLGRPEDAMHAYRAALELDAQHPAALEGLKRLYRTAGQREGYLDTLEAEIDAGVAPDPVERYAELALEWEALPNRLDRAAAAWQKLLAIDGAHPAAHHGLARVLRKAGRWDALAAAARSHLNVTSGAPERVAILLELADGLGRLDDLDGAARALQEVLTIDPQHPAALDALARVHDRAGRWQDAHDILERLAGRAAEPRDRADLLQRIGRIHADRGDLASARGYFEQSLAADPRNAAAHEGIGRVYRDQGEHALAGHHLLRAAQTSAGPTDTIRCLMAAAEVFDQRLGDVDRARDCLQRVLDLDDEHAEAKRYLNEILHRAGQWEALWPHLEERVRRTQADPEASPKERHDALTQAARCAAAMGNFAKAIELYDVALRADPADVGVLIARADALCESQAWDAADKALHAILRQHGSALERAQAAGVYRRLAQAQKALGRPTQMLAHYLKVLELDPTHRETLEELADVQIQRARFEEAIGTLRTLGEVVAPAERPAILERIGDLHREKLANPQRAVSVYLDVIALEPGSRRVLQKLLDVQTESRQWKYALDTIGRFLDLETDPARRGAYFQAAATIQRFELKDEAAALDAYEHALDAFFAGGGALDGATRTRALEAFQGVDEILTARQDWPAEERAYRAMIERVPEHDPLRVTLWHGLGEIYRTRLKQYERAIEAFETAHGLDAAKDPERVRILAELYALVGKASAAPMTERAAALVQADPSNPDAYRALGRASLDAGRIDEAWCVCRALVQMKQATPAEEELYRRHQEHERRKAKGMFDDDAWDLVRDAAEDRVVSAIFALIWEAPVALRAGPPKSFSLKESEKLKVEGGTGPMAKIFLNAARVLNAPLPHVYVQPERSGRLMLANLLDGRRIVPAMVVGRDLMVGFRDTEIAFAVASTLALLRPAYYLRLALPAPDELEAALVAAAILGGKKVTAPPQLAPLAQAFAAEMQKRLAPPALEHLRELVRRLPEQPDLLAWRNAVDTAARRAGLLVCGELAAAASMIGAEPVHPGGLRAAEKVRDLVVYSVSSGYFAARRHLGVNVA